LIGDNVTVGANAVVTKSLEDRVVAVGIPAKVVRRIDQG
jgi:serine O-acetyltransferase